jgi:hypothetical protein
LYLPLMKPGYNNASVSTNGLAVTSIEIRPPPPAPSPCPRALLLIIAIKQAMKKVIVLFIYVLFKLKNDFSRSFSIIITY